MNKAIIAIIAVVVIAAGVFAITHKSKKPAAPTNSNTSTTTAPSNTTSTPPTSTSTSSDNVITYSNSGFSPATLTVKGGSQVTIKNTSSETLQLDSNPHPQHTDDPELNVGVISAGGSKTFTVTTTGSHGYHNHLDPSDTGMLVVE